MTGFTPTTFLCKPAMWWCRLSPLRRRFAFVARKRGQLLISKSCSWKRYVAESNKMRSDGSRHESPGRCCINRRSSPCCRQTGSSQQTREAALSLSVVSFLSFDQHVTNVFRGCNYHLRSMYNIRLLIRLTRDVAKVVACSMVFSRLGYCNALLTRTCNKLHFIRLIRLLQ